MYHTVNLCAALKDQNQNVSQQNDTYLKAFALIDADRDGAITSEELVRVIEKVGGRMEEDEARGLIRRADSDKNGAISYEEFNTLWTSLKGGEDVG